MTAAEEQLVAELAEALDNTATGLWMGVGWGRLLAAELLPVVLADRRRAVAEALREAAEEIPCGVFSSTSDWLLARADAVEGRAALEPEVAQATCGCGHPISEHLDDGGGPCRTNCGCRYVWQSRTLDDVR